MLDPKKISMAIRAKKRQLAEAQPELVDTDARPDVDPQDLYNMEQTARIEKTLDVPTDLTDADKENLDMSEDEALSIASKRKLRLSKYIDSRD